MENNYQQLKEYIDAQNKQLGELIALNIDIVKNKETMLKTVRTLFDIVKLLSARLDRIEKQL